MYRHLFYYNFVYYPMSLSLFSFRLPEIPEKAKLIYHVTLNECGDPPNYGKMQIKDRFSIADRRRNRGNFYFQYDM